MDRTAVIGLPVFPTSYEKAALQIVAWAQENQARAVFAANVHMLMEAHDSPDFQAVLERADLVTPDGMPLVWMLRWKGVKGQPRVYGPTLMLHVLEKAAEGRIPVGFYGAAPDTLEALVDRMRDRFPGLQSVYAFSPPFRPLTVDEDKEITEEIKRSGARILFVGLGCPRQEIWIDAHRERLNLVMLGVGAAFDFHAGRKKQAPGWIQRMGLEWLFRLTVEPGRLAGRYLYTNPRFMALAFWDLLGLYKGRD